MENKKGTLQRYCNSLNILKCKLALKAPKQNFTESMLQDVAKVMTVDVKIISKLPEMDSDPKGYAERNRCDWYCIEVSGTFDDLYMAIVNWRELGVEQYVAISSQPLNYTT